MKTAVDILEERISAAMAATAGRDDCAAIVRPATDAKFGDYQANGIMGLAKKMKTNPRKLAEEVVKKLDLSDICEPPEVAGPGFINLRLKAEFVAGELLEINKDTAGLGIEKTPQPKTIVVDFSSPNIAKEMHVGHLRSTIIGDCICRMLRCLGHNKVIPQNHVGDWGTQFGMLCALYSRKRDKAIRNGDRTFPYLPLTDLESFYKEAKILFDTDEKFAQEAREAIAGLHSGDQIWMGHWRQIVRQTEEHFEEIYRKLGTLNAAANIRGESFYKYKLKDVVEELLNRKIAVESDEAVCVFPPGFKNKEGQPLPFIIQKSDGAYLYATTDLAALRYRVTGIEYQWEIYKADKIIYVTDSRQKLHFEMLFKVAEIAGWVRRDNLKHVTFGTVLGEDGSPLKTRSGENVKLKELLDEAIERAMSVVEEKNPELSPKKKKKIAKAVGIGAVKYADYSNNRTSDYIFSFDKMLAMDGNTAPYMQYAYARICSIMDKGKSEKGIDIAKEISNVKILNLTESSELDLAKQLIRYGEAIQSAVSDYRPNYLTAYLYELAQKFSAFYTNCPVLVAGPDKRPTRLLLCDLTARTIKHGLHELLGIEVVEQM
jgi:arginyl-tRNA synthetase